MGDLVESNIYPLTFYTEEGNWENNSNENLSVHVPTVASIYYFIRNVENYLGNPVPTGTTVIKKKNPNGHKEPSLLTILSITKTIPSSRVLLVMTQDTYFD